MKPTNRNSGYLFAPCQNFRPFLERRMQYAPAQYVIIGEDIVPIPLFGIWNT
ncbi:hypothetical protein [Caedibacter taeniospiralis]|uniref:hypothetical protein n=1 Tax=Caedibacter taeniospiralis TaxID=28907 RepID=UPI001302536F|nr:hypothetical protein [Caedibacter taeniospiralis]